MTIMNIHSPIILLVLSVVVLVIGAMLVNTGRRSVIASFAVASCAGGPILQM